MPEYLFRSDDGREITRYFPAGECPQEIGVYKRVWTANFLFRETQGAAADAGREGDTRRFRHLQQNLNAAITFKETGEEPSFGQEQQSWSKNQLNEFMAKPVSELKAMKAKTNGKTNPVRNRKR